MERGVLAEIQGERLPHEDVRDQNAGSRSQNERDERGHGQVQGKDFDHEDDAGDRDFEDGREGGGRPATQQQRAGFGVQVEQAGEIGPYGCACAHCRAFQTDRSAEADGERGGDQRCIGGAERQQGFSP